MAERLRTGFSLQRDFDSLHAFRVFRYGLHSLAKTPDLVGKDHPVETQVEALLVISVVQLGHYSAVVSQVAFFVKTIYKRLWRNYRHWILLPSYLHLSCVEVYQHVNQRIYCIFLLKSVHLDGVFQLQSEMRIHQCRIIRLVVDRLSPIK